MFPPRTPGMLDAMAHDTRSSAPPPRPAVERPAPPSAAPLDVARLTTAARAGDPDAFAAIYTARFDYTLALARRFSGLDESSCLDIVQNAMIRAIRRMKPLPDPAALDAWLARLVRSAAYDHLRRESRRRRREIAAAEASSANAAAAPTSAPRTESLDDRLAWLRSELAAFDRLTAELLDMRFRAGMTLDAIARRAGMKPGAVHGRITRALDDLRARSEEDPHD